MMNEPSARDLLEMRSLQGDRVIRPLEVSGVHAILKIPLADAGDVSGAFTLRLVLIAMLIIFLAPSSVIKTSTNWDCGRISDRP